MESTQWAPGIIVLLAGLVAAAFFVFANRKRLMGTAQPSATGPDDLELRYQQLLGQLKDLANDRQRLSEEAYAQEKARLELEAAKLLQQRDERKGAATGQVPSSAPAPAAPAAAPEPGMNPQMRNALWVGGIVAFFVVIGFVLSRESGEKPERPGMDGSPMGQMPNQPPEDPMFTAALGQLSRNPDDLALLNRVTHELIQREDFGAANELASRAIGVDPFDLEARVHRAVLDGLGGKIDVAATELERLADLYPLPFEATLYAGAMRAERGENARAVELLERFLREAPPDMQPPQLRAMIQQLRTAPPRTPN